MSKISLFIPNDLSFFRKYKHCFAFFKIEWQWVFHVRMLLTKVLMNLKKETCLTIEPPIMSGGGGGGVTFFRRKSIIISFVLVTLRSRLLLSRQSTIVLT